MFMIWYTLKKDNLGDDYFYVQFDENNCKLAKSRIVYPVTLLNDSKYVFNFTIKVPVYFLFLCKNNAKSEVFGNLSNFALICAKCQICINECNENCIKVIEIRCIVLVLQFQGYLDSK